MWSFFVSSSKKCVCAHARASFISIIWNQDSGGVGDGNGGGSDGNTAFCHSMVMLPQTTPKFFNRFKFSLVRSLSSPCQLLIRLKTWLKVFVAPLLLLLCAIINFTVSACTTYECGSVCVFIGTDLVSLMLNCIYVRYGYGNRAYFFSFFCTESHLHRFIYSLFFLHFSTSLLTIHTLTTREK